MFWIPRPTTPRRLSCEIIVFFWFFWNLTTLFWFFFGFFWFYYVFGNLRSRILNTVCTFISKCLVLLCVWQPEVKNPQYCLHFYSKMFGFTVCSSRSEGGPTIPRTRIYGAWLTAHKNITWQGRLCEELAWLSHKSTVAILAQGTSRAVADSQAFFSPRFDSRCAQTWSTGWRCSAIFVVNSWRRWCTHICSTNLWQTSVILWCINWRDAPQITRDAQKSWFQVPGVFQLFSSWFGWQYNVFFFWLFHFFIIFLFSSKLLPQPIDVIEYQSEQGHFGRAVKASAC